jgi:hypothetical protein
MPISESFSIVTEEGMVAPQLFPSLHDIKSAKLVDLNLHLVTELRAQYSDLIVT